MDEHVPKDSGSEAAAAGNGQLRWRSTLRGRLMLWSSVSSVSLLLLVSLGTYLAVRSILLDNAQTELRALAAQSTGAVQARLDSVATSARTLLESVRAVSVQEDQLKGLLRATVNGDPDVAGAMLIVEPGGLPGSARGFHWYVRLEDEGFHEQPMRYDGYDYTRSDWWPRTLDLRRAWWSEPYANEATGHQWFSTFNQPLRDADGTVVGLVSLDVALEQLKRQVQAGAIPGVEAALLSPGGMIAVHSNEAIIMQLTLDQRIAAGRPDLQPVADAVAARESATIVHVHPRTGVRRRSLVQPVVGSGWSLVMTASEDVVLERLHVTTRYLLSLGAIAALLSVLLVRIIARRTTAPLMDVAESAGHFARGEFGWPLPHTGRRDEVGLLARAFDRARRSIRSQLREIGEMTAARQKLESELAIAREIQLAMLPQGSLKLDGVEVHGHLQAAKAVGGDFYGYFQREGRQLWFVIGDVSDKGVPAALFMARTVTVIEIAASRGGSPREALRLAARQLAEHNEACMFATVLCGVVEIDNGAISLASAGHEPPLLVSANGDRRPLPVEPGGVLGVDADVDFSAWRGQLADGDTLLLYTDGVSEAFDAGNVAFGVERLTGLALDTSSAETVCMQVVDAVHTFAGDAPQSDDITVLAIVYRQRANREREG